RNRGKRPGERPSLTLAWLAFRMAHRPADWQRTYGFHRFQVLAAYSDGLTLGFIALAIVYAAVRRLDAPTEVLAAPMLANRRLDFSGPSETTSMSKVRCFT